MSFLRQAVSRDEVNQVWRKAYNQPQPGPIGCPGCGQKMREVAIRLKSGTVDLDVCRPCQFVWLDGAEFDKFTPTEVKVDQARELPLEAREAVARLRLARLERRGYDLPTVEGPEEIWKVVPAVFGFPVEEETGTRNREPFATWGLAALVFVVSTIAFGYPALAERLAWLPSEPLRLGGATWLTSFFVHIGVIHLIGNLYFLVTFGDNVEDLLGSTRFLALVLVAELAGAVGHLLLASDLTVPVVGASGGISGVLAFYGIRLPQARIGLFFWYYFRGGWLSIPAWGALVLWLLLQTWIAYDQARGWTSVSAGAHLGGAAVGLILGFFSRR